MGPQSFFHEDPHQSYHYDKQSENWVGADIHPHDYSRDHNRNYCYENYYHTFHLHEVQSCIVLCWS